MWLLLLLCSVYILKNGGTLCRRGRLPLFGMLLPRISINVASRISRVQFKKWCTMVRQYRIDRYNGLEVLVCECFRKHTWTQSEHDAFISWKHQQESVRPNQVYLPSDFSFELNEWLDQVHDDEDTFFGLVEPIPVYDNLPAVVLRSVVVANRPASLQVDFAQSVLSPEILDEVNRFFNVFDSKHWRNSVSCQIERYGSLFASFDD